MATKRPLNLTYVIYNKFLLISDNMTEETEEEDLEVLEVEGY